MRREVRPLADIAGFLQDRVAPVHGRPPVIAVDGRSGAGKTTFAAKLAGALPGAATVHTDDLAWHHSFFGWAELLVDVLAATRSGGPVRYRPPAWDQRGRPGTIEVPAGARSVIVEGVGAARREAAHLVDAIVWVESDAAQAEVRGIARDGGDAAATEFWHRWMAEEIPFLAADRPWERADLIVDGTPTVPHDPATEVVTASALELPQP